VNEQEVARLIVRVMGDATQYHRMLNQATSATQRFTSMLGFSFNNISLAGLTIRFSSMFEQLQTSFGTMLGSDGLGRRMISELRQLAAETPLTMTGVAQGARELLQYGVYAGDVVDVLRRIGDISGQTEEQMHRMTRAYGQVMSMGALHGQERRQMINAGFDPIAEISRTTGRSTGDLLSSMRQGGISAQMVVEAFHTATTAGGRFNDAMLRQNRTLYGLWSNLRDDAIRTLARLGDDLVEMLNLKQIVRGVTDMVNKFRQWYEALSPTVRRAIVQVIGLTGAFIGLATSMGILRMTLLATTYGFGVLENFISFLLSPLVMLGWQIRYTVVGAFTLLRIAFNEIIAVAPTVGRALFFVGEVAFQAFNLASMAIAGFGVTLAQLPVTVGTAIARISSYIWSLLPSLNGLMIFLGQTMPIAFGAMLNFLSSNTFTMIGQKLLPILDALALRFRNFLLNFSWGDIIYNIGSGISYVVTGIGSLTMGFIRLAATGVAALFQGITSAVWGLGRAISSVFVLSARGFIGMFTMLGPTFWVILGVMTAIAVLVSDDLNPSTWSMTAAWNAVKQAAVDLFNFLFPVWNAFQGAVRGFAVLAVTVWNEAGEGLATLLGYGSSGIFRMGLTWRDVFLGIREWIFTAFIYLEFHTRRSRLYFQRMQLGLAMSMVTMWDSMRWFGRNMAIFFTWLGANWRGALVDMGNMFVTFFQNALRNAGNFAGMIWDAMFGDEEVDWAAGWRNMLEGFERVTPAIQWEGFNLANIASPIMLDLQRQFNALERQLGETWEQFRDRRLREIEMANPLRLADPETFEPYGQRVGENIAQGIGKGLKDWDHVLFRSAEANRRIEAYRNRLMGLETDPHVRGGAHGMRAGNPNMPNARDVNAFRGNDIVAQLQRVNNNLEGNPQIQINQANLPVNV